MSGCRHHRIAAHAGAHDVRLRDTSYPGVPAFSPPGSICSSRWRSKRFSAAVAGLNRRHDASVGRVIERLTIRTALLAGFRRDARAAAVCRLSRDAPRAPRAAQQRRHRLALPAISQEPLAPARAQVLEASVLLRAALLDPDVTASDRTSPEHRKRPTPRSIRCRSECMRFSRPRAGGNGNAGRIASRAEIQEFRLASDEVLATDSSRWPAEARTLLRRFMPKRESAIHLRMVQALNRAAFIDQQREITQTHRPRCSAARSGPCSGVALGISLVIGLAGIAACGVSIERRLTEQRDHERNALPATLAAVGATRPRAENSSGSPASTTKWDRR